MEFFPLLLQEYCSRLLRNDASLKELSLKCAGMNNHDSLQPLLRRLQNNTTVHTLDLYGNEIRGATTDLIGQVLMVNVTMKVLKLDKNVIDCNAIVNICKGLRHNTSLKELSLDDNIVGSDGGVALGEMLSHNCSIEKLSLRCNRIGTRGATAIFKGLLQNKESALTELCLGFNDIGQAAQALEELLVSNRSLKVLRLWCSGLGTKGATTIARGLSQNVGLEELYIGQNGAGDEGAIAFAQCLCTNRTLKKLYLYRNNIGIKGAKALLHAVKHFNFSMETIKLGSTSGSGEEFDLVEKELSYWLEVNGAGRGHVFLEATTLPHPLWPLVLARASSQPNAISCFLHAKPDLVKS